MQEKWSFYWHIPIKQYSVLTSNSFFPAVVKAFVQVLFWTQVNAVRFASEKSSVMESHLTKIAPTTESGKSSGDEYPLSASLKTGGGKKPAL